MSESVVVSHFNEHAAAYDDRWRKLAPMSETLHFLMRAVLLDLPHDARILCVGAGTGAELLALARHFPGWRFMAVDPSGAMLDVCREKANYAGISSRCEFHEGYIDSLDSTVAFDAATSILVSHFITIPDDRRKYFHQIALRLRPGGYLVSADLASSLDALRYERLVETWLRAHDGTATAQNVASCCSAWGKGVAISSPSEIESIIASSGFETPIPFYQALFIHGWYTRRSPQATT